MEKSTNKSKFIVHTQLDSKDDLEEKLEKCYNFVSLITSKHSEREGVDALQNFISRGQHDEIQCGLVYAILVEEKTAQKHYKMMVLVSQDNMHKTTNLVNQVIYEKWIKLHERIRVQIVWLVKEMIRNGVVRTDGVVHNLLRQIAGGDLSAKNVWLSECMLDMLIKHRTWLDSNLQLIPSVVFTFTRLMADHAGMLVLRQKEVDLCVSLLREKWTECQSIGRDLVRLLQAVARIPEVADLWRDIQTNPSKLSPNFTGVTKLMHTKTSRNLLISRLTPDMEAKIGFLTTQVKFGNQRRYQDWFLKQYLSTPESQSLRCDLIRYICSVIHPSNEVLSSDIIPRWAVIGWLLTTCTSNLTASYAKLALFYDWLFFESERDSIMNIEPCILVMSSSLKAHPAITATLLDFMCRISNNFHPSLIRDVRTGIHNSLNVILEKKVLQSLVPLFCSLKLDKDLTIMLKNNFPEFCNTFDNSPNNIAATPTTPTPTPTTTTNNNNNNNNNKPMISAPSFSEDPIDSINNIAINTNNNANNNTINNNANNNNDGGVDNDSDNGGSSVNDVAYFSDDDDTTPAKVKKATANQSNKTSSLQPITAKEDEPIKTEVTFELDLYDLDDQFKDTLTLMIIEKDNETKGDLLDKLLQQVVNADSLEAEDVSELSRCLCELLQLPKKIMPEIMDDGSLEDSIELPVFVIFRNLQQMSEDEQERSQLLSLLEQMYVRKARLGYYFLYFLKASAKVKHEVHMQAYRDFCNCMSKPLQHYILSDLKTCLQDDVYLFSFLIPDIYSQFPTVAVGNVELLHLIVASIDGTQLQELTCEILQGHLNMFSKDTFLPILSSSLSWESIEQYFFWQLVTTHDLPPSHYLPIINKLNFKKHAEAVTSIMMLLKQDGPTAENLRPLLVRECRSNDLLTVSMLRYWAQEYADKLADLMNNQLNKLNGSSYKRKMGKMTSSSKTPKDQPSIQQILSHLDHMRITCKDISFLSNESIQQALQIVQTSCTDSVKVKYGDLLALVEDIEESKSTRVLRQVPSRRASQAATKHSSKAPPSKRPLPDNHSDSSSHSSDEEDTIQVMKSKKSKRSVLFDD